MTTIFSIGEVIDGKPTDALLAPPNQFGPRTFIGFTELSAATDFLKKYTNPKTSTFKVLKFNPATSSWDVVE